MKLRLLFVIIFGVAVAPTGQPASGQEPIRIGLVAPFSGPFAFLGAELADGADTAIETINERGGLLRGRKIQLVRQDDACTPNRAALGFEALVVRDKVDAVLGFPCGEAALEAKDAGRKLNFDGLMIMTASMPALTVDAPDGLIRLFGRSDSLGRFAADVAWGLGNKEIAIVTAAGVRGDPFPAGAAERLAQKGIKPAEYSGQPAEMVKAVERTGQTLILSAAGGLRDAFIRSGSLGKLATNVVIPLPVVSPEFLGPIPPRPTIAVVANAAPRADRARPIQAQARARNRRADGYFFYGYAGIEVYAKAAATAGESRGAKLTAAAKSEPTETVLGPLRFDKSGEPLGWRFEFLRGDDKTFASIDVCKRPDCKEYSQCSPDCPN